MSPNTGFLQQATALPQFLRWVVHDWQRYNETLRYARLPGAAVRAAEAQLRILTYRGAPLLR